MNKFGLIGKNIEYSKSKVIHEIISEKLNHNVNYEIISLKEDKDLINYLNKLRNKKYQGFNVTIPYKEVVMDYLDIVNEKAKKIGAVNTIYEKDGLLIGTNTDYDGFKLFLEMRKIDLKNKNVLILGSGGAAKAIYNVFKDNGIIPIIATIEPEINYPFEKIIKWDLIDDSYDIYVNATPVGTHPNINQSPIDVSLIKEKVVLDVIYNPKITKLMENAKISYNGYDMLIIQAIKAQLIWFNKDFVLNANLVDNIKERLK